MRLTREHPAVVTPAGERQYVFRASDRDYDLENDRLLGPWDLEGYKQNPVILASHAYRELPVAKATAVWETREALFARIMFPPRGISSRADECAGLVAAGYLKTVSVGFDVLQVAPGRNERGGKDFLGQRLLEISLVSVPANPRASLQETTKMRRWLTGGGADDDVIHLDLDELLGPVTIDLDAIRDAIAEAESTRRQRAAIANYAHLESVMSRTRRGR